MIHRVPMGRKNQFLLLGLCIATVTTIYYFAEQEKNFIIENVPLFYENVNTSSPAYIIDTPGCKIPNVDPFDKSVLKYIKNPTTMKCSDKLPLIQSDQRSIWIDEDALKTYKFKKASDIECCYADLNTSSAYLNNINQEDAYIQR